MRSWKLAVALIGATAAALAAAVVLLFAGSASGQATGQKAGVNIVDFDYDARTIKVPVGTTLTWTNTGGRPHTATDRGGTFDTQPIDPGASASVQLTVPGTYFYFCRINPSKMNGVVQVEPAATAPVVRVQAVDDGNIEGEKLRFDPPELSVKAGTTLLFANAGGKPHSLTADDNSFTTGVVQPGPEKGRFAGSNATLTLTKPGTFAYHCDIHPQAMKGTITVTGDPVAGAPPPPSAGARTASVDMEDFAFKEPQISVAPGAAITFTNKGAAPHTATFDDVAGLDTATLQGGQSATLTAPSAPGSYSYKCTIHPAKMRGVLVVLGQSTPDPVRATTATTAAAAGGGGNDATGSAAAPTPPTLAPTPPAGATAAAGVSGGISVLVMVTALGAAFLAGIGITPFFRRRAQAAKPATP